MVYLMDDKKNEIAKIYSRLDSLNSSSSQDELKSVISEYICSSESTFRQYSVRAAAYLEEGEFLDSVVVDGLDDTDELVRIETIELVEARKLKHFVAEIASLATGAGTVLDKAYAITALTNLGEDSKLKYFQASVENEKNLHIKVATLAHIFSFTKDYNLIGRILKAYLKSKDYRSKIYCVNIMFDLADEDNNELFYQIFKMIKKYEKSSKDNGALLSCLNSAIQGLESFGQ